MLRQRVEVAGLQRRYRFSENARDICLDAVPRWTKTSELVHFIKRIRSGRNAFDAIKPGAVNDDALLWYFKSAAFDTWRAIGIGPRCFSNYGGLHSRHSAPSLLPILAGGAS